MRPLTLVCFLLFLAGIFLGLVQLWCAAWSAETFFKLIVTDGALFAVSFVLAFLIKESTDSRKIDKGNGLD